MTGGRAAPTPTLAYSTALLRLWSAVKTDGGCVGCDLTDVRHPGCGCPCHEAEALLRATGVLREPKPAPTRKRS